MPLLGYADWGNFEMAIDRAKGAAANTGAVVVDHFYQVAPSGGVGDRLTGQYKVGDFKLSRYASYLTYFAVKTREAEISAL